MAVENSLQTPMEAWRVLRIAAAENGAAAVNLLTGFTFHQQKDNCIDLYNLGFGTGFAGLTIAMYGDSLSGQTCDDNDIFGFDLIGYRSPLDGYSNSENGYNPALLICSAATGLAKVGTARASGDGGVTETGRWMDSVTLSNTQWPNGVGIYADGNNKMMLIRFDANGIRYIYPYVHGALGAQAGECPAVGMIITAYQ